jgi:hypothetical protein
MDRVCSTFGRDEKCTYNIGRRSLRGDLRDLSLYWRIILKWNLRIEYMKVCTTSSGCTQEPMNSL